MENLSPLEAALLLSVQCHPGKVLSDYATELSDTYMATRHASYTLKRLDYITVDAEGMLWLNDEHIREENAAISKEFASANPVVHTLVSSGR